jgi:colanic acid/amylovoran biosynthesis glycosyltransferase
MREHRTASNENRAQAKQRLRVAMFVHEFPALSETFVLNQITGLIDLGHDVTVFATGPRGDPIMHPDVQAYRLLDRLHYRAMPANRFARLLAAPAVAAQCAPRRPGALLKSLNLTRYARDAWSLSLLYWVNCLRAQKAFDIVHCHFGTVGREVAFLREIGAIRGRLVVSFHGVDMSACLEHGDGLYRHLFERGDLFLPISEHWRQRLIEMGSDPTRTRVHRMGVDLTRFPFQDRARISAGRPVEILTVGRLVEKKGIEYGLRAVARLASHGMPLRYSIVGDGPLRAGLEELARALGIAEQVVFLGWQHQDRVVEILRASDILLAPSVTDSEGDQEGIPVTLMEAMASGVLVVSTRHSGIPELVSSGMTGLLAEERDVDGLAGALARLWSDPGLGERMAVAARAKVVAAFDVGALNKRLEAEYRMLLSVPAASPGAVTNPPVAGALVQRL